MAVTGAPYGQFFVDLMEGVHAVLTDTTNAALLTSSYTPNYDTHKVLTDVNSNEVAGTGYTAGGNTLTGKTVTYDTGTKLATLGAASTTWNALTAVCRYAVIYKVGGTAATSPLIGLIDFGADRTYSVEPFQLSFPTGAVVLGKTS